MRTQRFGRLLFLPVMAMAVAMTSGCMHDVEKLSEQLQSPDSFVRWEAAEKLGDTNKADAVAPLIVALGDITVEVRNAASDSLAKLGKPSVKPLVATLKGRDVQIKAMALATLGTMGDKLGAADAAAITAALKDKSAQIRVAAVRTLVKLEEIGSIGALEICLKASSELQVKAAAKDAIKKLKAIALARRAAKKAAEQAKKQAEKKSPKAASKKTKSPEKTAAPKKPASAPKKP